MSTSLIDGIDHPVIAVRDMAEARHRFERAGFTVPPRGSHKEWGTGNWCIMFPRNYLELRGIVDAQRYTHGLDQFLAVREGLMGVAFASEMDVDHARDVLCAQGLNPPPVRQLTRRFELPEGEVEPSFKLLFFNPAETGPLMSSLICQHLTPQLLRKPEFLQHANGVRAIASVTAVASDLDEAANCLTQYFGIERVKRTDAAVHAFVGEGASVNVVSPEEAQRTGIELPVQTPYLAAVGLTTNSLETCRTALHDGGLAYREVSPKVLRLPADEACGVVLDFFE